ncbi:hypothetical protein [Paludisphaera soli]|uniref:hypothetical protein n=1 Tax=Paludisphaera soli TaxID=2712865 RepID=UPI0013EC82FA|nr:hypothetical protein [Paludisphaera soli]
MAGASWDLEQDDELVTIRTACVRIVFRRSGDRWTHEIGPPEGPPLVAAIEGDPASDDPARVLSPVYQEVQHHPFDDEPRRVRLLLTGLRHRHHFSAVLTVSTDDDGATTLDFDVADRCRDAVLGLAATYDVRLGAGEIQAADDAAIRWTLGAGSETLVSLASADASRLAVAERGPRAVQAQALAGLIPGAFTHRLRYLWTWASRSDRTR